MAKKKEEILEESEAEEKADYSKYYCKKHKHHHGGGGTGCGAIYFFGLVGALIYFFQRLGPGTVSNIFWAIVKSIAWPALFVYEALKFLKF